MNWGKTMAIAMMALSIASAIGYAAAGDYRRATYWTAASILTATVTL